MFILDILPTTKIPHTQQQLFSYFSGQKLPPGALVQIPLGRRKETGVVFDAHEIADHKMEIKRANFELRNISKIISAEPILTKQQLELALWLGQYYFASPGLFAKMSLPLSYSSSKPRSSGARREVLNSSLSRAQPRDSNSKIKQKLVLVPTIAQVESLAVNYRGSTLWHSGLKQKQRDEIWRQIKNGQAQIIVGTRSAVFLPFSNLKEIIIEDETNPNHKSWDMFPHYAAQTAAQKLAGLFKSKLTSKIFCHSECNEESPTNVGPHTREILRRYAPRDDNKTIPTIIDMRAELKAGNFSIFSRALQSAIKDALAKNQQIVLFINRRGAANFILCRDCGYIAKCQNCDASLAHHLINGRPTLLCHHCGAKDVPPSLCPKCQGSRVKTVGTGTQKVEVEAIKMFPAAKTARLDSDIAPQPKDQQKIINAFAKKEIDILITTQIIFSWLSEIKKAAPSVVAVLSADTLLHLPDFRSGERTWQIITTLKNLIAPSFLKEGRPPRLASGEAGGGFKSPSLPLYKGGENQTFIIQTYNPENSVMKYLAKNDQAGFAKEEQETRQTLNYPPFSQIVKLTFRHRDGQTAGQEAKILATKLKNIIAKQNNPEYSKNNQLTSSPQTRGGLRWGDENQRSDTTFPQPPPQLRRGSKNDIEISPALPAFIPRERGKFVWNIILKFSIFNFQFSINNEFLQKRNSLLQYVPQNWEIDIDPENLL